VLLQYVPIGVFCDCGEKPPVSKAWKRILALGDMVVGAWYIALPFNWWCYLRDHARFRLNDTWIFPRKARNGLWRTAFAPRSSSGTVALTITAARKLNIPQRNIQRFRCRLGRTINMDGAGPFRIAISAVFCPANVVAFRWTLMTMAEIWLIWHACIRFGTAWRASAVIGLICLRCLRRLAFPLKNRGVCWCLF